MLVFIALLAVLDLFVGEFGSRGTPAWIVFLTLPVSIVGLIRWVKLFGYVRFSMHKERMWPDRETIASLTFFFLLQFVVFALVLYGEVPPDDPAVILAAACSLFVRSVPREVGWRQAPSLDPPT